MKKIKTIVLCIALCFIAINNASAMRNGPNCWDCSGLYKGQSGDHMLVDVSTGYATIWPILKQTAALDNALFPESLEAEFTNDANVNSIVVTNGADFNYTCDQSTMNDKVDISNWSFGSYQAIVTFVDGSVGYFNVTIK